MLHEPLNVLCIPRVRQAMVFEGFRSPAAIGRVSYSGFTHVSSVQSLPSVFVRQEYGLELLSFQAGTCK